MRKKLNFLWQKVTFSIPKPKRSIRLWKPIRNPIKHKLFTSVTPSPNLSIFCQSYSMPFPKLNILDSKPLILKKRNLLRSIKPHIIFISDTKYSILSSTKHIKYPRFRNNSWVFWTNSQGHNVKIVKSFNPSWYAFRYWKRLSKTLWLPFKPDKALFPKINWKIFFIDGWKNHLFID